MIRARIHWSLRILIGMLCLHGYPGSTVRRENTRRTILIAIRIPHVGRRTKNLRGRSIPLYGLGFVSIGIVTLQVHLDMRVEISGGAGFKTLACCGFLYSLQRAAKIKQSMGTVFIQMNKDMAGVLGSYGNTFRNDPHEEYLYQVGLRITSVLRGVALEWTSLCHGGVLRFPSFKIGPRRVHLPRCSTPLERCSLI
ncbi:hypothetical protein F4802DRAFT_125208 [Xylaria palmicola]|nr:hypothetical protein F4802DRAFT_125208 [Xylaria palmicola]